MLFKCLPTWRGKFRGGFRGLIHARGKWFTVDIHCHVLDPEGRARWSSRRCRCDAAAAGAVRQRAHPRGQPRSRPSATASSSPRSRSGSPTWTAWGSTSRRSRPRRTQTYYSRRPRSRHRHRAGRQRQPRRHLPAVIPIALSRSARCRSRPPSSRSPNSTGCTNRSGFARHRDRHQRRRRGSVRAERFRTIFARVEELGLLIFMHPTGFPEARRFARPLPDQCDRQPARHDRRGRIT